MLIKCVGDIMSMIGTAILILILLVTGMSFLCLDIASGEGKSCITEIEELSNESLKQFLEDDKTEDQYYEYQIHDCMDFSIELAHNLTDAGYTAGVVEQYPTAKGVDIGHVIVWVCIGNYTIYIEPQNDRIYTPQQYTDLFDTKKYALAEMPTVNMEIQRAGYRLAYEIRKGCFTYLLW